MGKKRDSGIELLRILLCFCVIMIHDRNSAYFDEHKLLDSLAKPIWFLCNSCFFMISGYYAISSKKIFNREGVQQYYKKKVLTVLLPLVLYSVLYFADERVATGQTVLSIDAFFDFLMRFSANKIQFHLWFVYSLLGSLLAVPILVYTFKDMPTKVRNIIFIIGTVIMQGQILLSNFNIEFSISFVLTGWFYVFCIGWFTEVYVMKKHEKWLYLAGIVGYILTVLGMYFLPVYKNATDWALPHIIFSAAVFILFKRHISVNGKIIGRVVEFIARYTFSIYLIHVMVLRRLTPNVLPVNIENPIGNHIFDTMRTFMLSLVIVAFIDYLMIRPVKHIMNQFRPKKKNEKAKTNCIRKVN